MIILAIVAVMGLIELTVGREDYGSSEAEPGKLGEFWQAARPADPQVGANGTIATDSRIAWSRAACEAFGHTANSSDAGPMALLPGCHISTV